MTKIMYKHYFLRLPNAQARNQQPRTQYRLLILNPPTDQKTYIKDKRPAIRKPNKRMRNRRQVDLHKWGEKRTEESEVGSCRKGKKGFFPSLKTRPQDSNLQFCTIIIPLTQCSVPITTAPQVQPRGRHRQGGKMYFPCNCESDHV